MGRRDGTDKGQESEATRSILCESFVGKVGRGGEERKRRREE